MSNVKQPVHRKTPPFFAAARTNKSEYTAPNALETRKGVVTIVAETRLSIDKDALLKRRAGGTTQATKPTEWDNASFRDFLEKNVRKKAWLYTDEKEDAAPDETTKPGSKSYAQSLHRKIRFLEDNVTLLEGKIEILEQTIIENRGEFEREYEAQRFRLKQDAPVDYNVLSNFVSMPKDKCRDESIHQDAWYTGMRYDLATCVQKYIDSQTSKFAVLQKMHVCSRLRELYLKKIVRVLLRKVQFTNVSRFVAAITSSDGNDLREFSEAPAASTSSSWEAAKDYGPEKDFASIQRLLDNRVWGIERRFQTADEEALRLLARPETSRDVSVEQFKESSRKSIHAILLQHQDTVQEDFRDANQFVRKLEGLVEESDKGVQRLTIRVSRLKPGLSPREMDAHSGAPRESSFLLRPSKMMFNRSSAAFRQSRSSTFKSPGVPSVRTSRVSFAQGRSSSASRATKNQMSLEFGDEMMFPGNANFWEEEEEEPVDIDLSDSVGSRPMSSPMESRVSYAARRSGRITKTLHGEVRDAATQTGRTDLPSFTEGSRFSEVPEFRTKSQDPMTFPEDMKKVKPPLVSGWSWISSDGKKVFGSKPGDDTRCIFFSPRTPFSPSWSSDYLHSDLLSNNFARGQFVPRIAPLSSKQKKADELRTAEDAQTDSQQLPVEKQPSRTSPQMTQRRTPDRGKDVPAITKKEGKKMNRVVNKKQMRVQMMSLNTGTETMSMTQQSATKSPKTMAKRGALKFYEKDQTPMMEALDLAKTPQSTRPMDTDDISSAMYRIQP